MKHGFRQSMAWLHTWSGLIVGWILFAVFLTGTASYLRPEISAWMRPELRAVSAPADTPEATLHAAERALDGLARLAPQSRSWFIGLPSARDPVLHAAWQEPKAPGRGFREAVLDPRTGEPIAARDTRGGEFFYRFHFQLHYLNVPLARWIVSFCAMCMLVAIISGIVTHKRIFADFFTFRPGKGRRSWLDGHVVAAVLALPYHLMITYTGLLTLAFMTMPWGVQSAYKADGAAFNAAVFGLPPLLPASGQPAPTAPLGPMLRQVREHWNGVEPGRMTVRNPGDSNAVIQFTLDDDDRLSSAPRAMTFRAATGEQIGTTDRPGPALATQGVLYGLHQAHFAGPWLRALFVLSGLCGTVMVASGCVLWASKTRQEAIRRGHVGFGTLLVEHLNVATIAGLPVAMAAFFWANRLLPSDMAERAAWEIHIFFLAWGACLVHPLLRRGRQSWVDQFAVCAGLFLLLPPLDAVTTQYDLERALKDGDWLDIGFWGGFLLLGLASALIARMIAAHRQLQSARARRDRFPAERAAAE